MSTLLRPRRSSGPKLHFVPICVVEQGSVSIYEYLEQVFKSFESFDTFATASKFTRPVLARWFPVQERIKDGSGKEKDNSNFLMIDTGGGLVRNIQKAVSSIWRPFNAFACTIADALVVEGFEAMP